MGFWGKKSSSPRKNTLLVHSLKTWQTSQINIVGELAGGGSLAVAVGVVYRLHMTHDFYVGFKFWNCFGIGASLGMIHKAKCLP